MVRFWCQNWFSIFSTCLFKQYIEFIFLLLMIYNIQGHSQKAQIHFTWSVKLTNTSRSDHLLFNTTGPKAWQFILLTAKNYIWGHICRGIMSGKWYRWWIMAFIHFCFYQNNPLNNMQMKLFIWVYKARWTIIGLCFSSIDLMSCSEAFAKILMFILFALPSLSIVSWH